MKVISCIFTVLFLFGRASGAEFNYLDSDKFGRQWTVADNVVVGDGVNVQVDRVNVAGAAVIINYGNIWAPINVCDNCDVYLINRGMIDGAISVGDNSVLTQVVHFNSDVVPLNVEGDFNVLVKGGDNISLTDVIGLGASKVVLNNSVMYLAPGSMMMRSASVTPIELVGESVIYLNNFNFDENVPILTNLGGTGTVSLMAEGLDSLHVLSGYIQGGNLYASLVRETDYVKILNNNSGAFLNALRRDNPDDKLLRALDSARSIDELKNIMSRSARMNPINMMRPIRMLNRLGWMENRDILDNRFSIGATPQYVIGEDFGFVGTDVSADLRLTDNLGMSVGGRAGTLDFSGDLDEYTATVYGANMAANYIGKFIVGHADFGATYSRFDVGAVFDGDGAVYDPDGFTLYGGLDAGVRFNPISDLHVVPMVGAYFDRAMILDDASTDVALRVMVDTSYNLTGYEIDYDYGLRLMADTAGAVGAMAHVAFHLPWDDAGGALDVGVVHDDFGLTFRFMINVRLQF